MFEIFHLKHLGEGKDNFLHQMMLWKLGIHMQKKEVGSLPNTLYEKQLNGLKTWLEDLKL